MGLFFSRIISSVVVSSRDFGFFHEDDIKLFGDITLRRLKAAQLREKMKRDKEESMSKKKRTKPIPEVSEMVQTSDEEGEVSDSEAFVTIKGVAKNGPGHSKPLTPQQESKTQANIETTDYRQPTPDGMLSQSPKGVSSSGIATPHSSGGVAKKVSLERMKEREEQRDFLAVTASSLKTRSEQRRLLGSVRRSARGHNSSPCSARSLPAGAGVVGSFPKTSISDNVVVGTCLMADDEYRLQRELDAIRLETILDTDEDEGISQDNNNNTEAVYYYRKDQNSPKPASSIFCSTVPSSNNNNESMKDHQDRLLEDVPVVDIEIGSPTSTGTRPASGVISPVEVRLESSSSNNHSGSFTNVLRRSSSYTVESLKCSDEDLLEEPTKKMEPAECKGDSLDPDLPAVWSEVEIFALIEIPQREEPLRIEYHRFGSTLDFSTRPAMDPSFSSNMTHEEMSALFEGDLDVGSKYGASHMLSLIPRLINAYEGFLIINGLEIRTIRTNRMTLKGILVDHHNVLLEVIPKSITEIELRRTDSRFEIEWRDEVALHTTKWMTIGGQQDKIAQLKLTKSKETKSVLLLTIPL